MRRRYSVDQWRLWIAEQSDRGETVASFCREKGIPENSFYRWRKKLSDQPIDSAAVFVPVSVVGNQGFEIRFPGDITMSVPRDEDAVRLIVDVLRDQEGSSC